MWITGISTRSPPTTDPLCGRVDEAKASRTPLSVGLLGNAADLLPRLLADGVAADIVTDQTSAHDPLSYMPNDLTPEAADDLRRDDPTEFTRRARASMAVHCEAMVGFMDAGAEVFDYGNSLRAEAKLGGFERAFDYPGFLPAYIRPLFCEGLGPFRWVALSGDPATSWPRIAGCSRSSQTTRAFTVGSRWRANVWRSRGFPPGFAGSATASVTASACASMRWCAPVNCRHRS